MKCPKMRPGHRSFSELVTTWTRNLDKPGQAPEMLGSDLDKPPGQPGHGVCPGVPLYKSGTWTPGPDSRTYKIANSPTWKDTTMSSPVTPSAAATHIVIPDTQAKPGVPTAHLTWIGRYIVDHFANRPNVRIIHLGDHWDMPSLSGYDRGKRAMEGRRVRADLEAGNDALDILDAPLFALNTRRRNNKERQWWPQRHMLQGNHEDRIRRATEDNAQLDGLLSIDAVTRKAETNGWTVHPFLQPFFLDGVGYAHFWANPMTGFPYGGMALTRLKTIGHSFTMGHQQTFDYAVRFVRDDHGQPLSQHALIAGACYLHDEDYKGYQGNAHWRGIVVCHEVRDGSYALMQVTLDYLCRRYEGVSLDDHKAQHAPAA